ncbi:MAG: hypothetical protein G01um10147_753 [Microgenomates group bacterium Gr01-1014_7]|nr:MAG: hypothetical protein G01um10147_753 [Microgenomates group bacterium Gr01-1014_7]
MTMIKVPPIPKKRIAIFIDAANFEISLKQCGLRVDYKKLLTEFRTKGKLTILRYYSPVFKTKGQNRFFSFIKNQGFKIVTKSIKVIRKRNKKSQNKANFDVEITFDAAVNIGKYETMILFSGDSDFVYLVSQLKKSSITTTVISPQWRTARELKKVADTFIDLRECDFVIKKPPFGGAHNSLSTAKAIYNKKGEKSSD